MKRFRDDETTQWLFDAEYVRRLAAGDPLAERHLCAYLGELVLIKLRGKVRSRELIEDYPAGHLSPP